MSLRGASLEDPRQGEGRNRKQHRNGHRDPVEVALGHRGAAEAPQWSHASAEGVGQAATLPRVEQDERDEPKRHDQMHRYEDASDQDESLSCVRPAHNAGRSERKYGGTAGSWQVASTPDRQCLYEVYAASIWRLAALGGSLGGDGGGRGGNLLWIPQIGGLDGPEGIVQGVHEGHSGGNVERRDLLL